MLVVTIISILINAHALKVNEQTQAAPAMVAATTEPKKDAAGEVAAGKYTVKLGFTKLTEPGTKAAAADGGIVVSADKAQAGLPKRYKVATAAAADTAVIVKATGIVTLPAQLTVVAGVTYTIKTETKALKLGSTDTTADIDYSFKGKAAAKEAKVKGDPHVSNLAGQKFDILALGTMSFLTVKQEQESSTANLLQLDGTITRVGRDCSQTFISNVTLKGSWIEEVTGSEVLSVRAVPSVPVENALEIGFNGKWRAASAMPSHDRNLDTEPRAFLIDLSSKSPGLKLKATTHQHHKWNFLNLNVQGLGQLADKMSNVQIGGILGYDDNTNAQQAPADCKTPKSIHLVKEEGASDQQEENEESAFLSFCEVS